MNECNWRRALKCIAQQMVFHNWQKLDRRALVNAVFAPNRSFAMYNKTNVSVNIDSYTLTNTLLERKLRPL